MGLLRAFFLFFCVDVVVWCVCVLFFLHTALLFACKWAASNSMSGETVNNGHIGGDPWRKKEKKKKKKHILCTKNKKRLKKEELGVGGWGGVGVRRWCGGVKPRPSLAIFICNLAQMMNFSHAQAGASVQKAPPPPRWISAGDCDLLI